MNFPPAARPGEHIRIDPATATTLSRAIYELRGRDGQLICAVGRKRAECGLRAGALELWRGPSGAYLRAAGLSRPDYERRQAAGRIFSPEPPRGVVLRPPTHDRTANGQVGGYRRLRVGPGRHK
jgi:hypothetical protein